MTIVFVPGNRVLGSVSRVYCIERESESERVRLDLSSSEAALVKPQRNSAK